MLPDSEVQCQVKGSKLVISLAAGSRSPLGRGAFHVETHLDALGKDDI